MQEIKLKVSVGKNRYEKDWQEQEMTFKELTSRVSTPKITSEKFAEFMSLSKEAQDDLKDVGGFVLGSLKDGKRCKDSVLSRSGAALDLDSIDNEQSFKSIIEQLDKLNYIYCLYSTRKHTKNKPRVRILFPFSKDCLPIEYEPVLRYLCNQIGIDYCDKGTVESNRFMYWPSISSDMVDQFVFKTGGEILLNPQDILDTYEDWTHIAEWPEFKGENLREKYSENTTILDLENNTHRPEDPWTKEGPVGDFCRCYTIDEVIETYLSDVYEPYCRNRYTYINGTSSGGAIVFDEGRFLYSYHSTDIAGGPDDTKRHLYNAYDLVRVHKFGTGTSSEKKMKELVYSDPRVIEAKTKEAVEEFEGIDIESAESKPLSKDEKNEIYSKIFAKLEKSDKKKGLNANTSDNVRIILSEDPELKDKFHFDTFTERIMVTKKLQWRNEDGNLPREWADSDDSGLRWYLEKFYKIKGKQVIDDAFSIECSNRRFHPVKHYLESLEWDGNERLETLLVDYFGAEDNVYTRDVMKKALVAAVTRIYEPGTKFDTMPILVGKQGTGKSTFLRYLGKSWYTDSLEAFSGKDAYEILQGNWIVEIGELNGFTKYEMNQIKNFLSKTGDDYRCAYGKRTINHPRKCVIFGTTNEASFLRDKTGNRRFWPVQLGVHAPTKSVFKDLPGEVDQIWAEAYTLYLVGDPLILTGESLQYSEQEQRSRLEEDPWEGMILDFIEKKIPKDWNKYNLSSRLAYWDTYDVGDEPIDCIEREKICSAEIACELFSETPGRINPQTTRRINSILNGAEGLEKHSNNLRYGKPYGRQRGYLILNF